MDTATSTTVDTGWTAGRMPRLDGKIVVVTGANSGIGLEATRGFARAGAHVVLACRNEQRAAEAIASIRAENATASLAFLPLDVSSLASVRAFADSFRGTYARLDVLVNNAGVMALPYRTTPDGFEMQFGTNYLGPFALTGLVLDRLVQAAPSRVVTVSSLAHHIGRIRLDDLQGERGYQKWLAYGQSKLAVLIFAYELARRFAARGLAVSSVACHPGYSSTNLQLAGARMTGATFAEALWKRWNAVGAQSANMGALPTLYAATAPDVRNGDIIGPDGFLEWSGHPKKVSSSARSRDPELARRLWDVSERLTGVRYDAALGALSR